MSFEGGEHTLRSEMSRRGEEINVNGKKKSEMNFFVVAPVSFVTKN